MNITEIINEIKTEGCLQRRRPTVVQRQSFRHCDIQLSREIQAHKTQRLLRHFIKNPRELIAKVYRIPILGYAINLVSYSLRLPTHIRKIQQELQQLRSAVSALESRLSLSAGGGDLEGLDEKIKSYQTRQQKFDSIGK